jgi:CHAT domain-containing protein
LQSTATSVDELSAHAAAVYPILLPDRVELLVSLPGRMLRVTSPTSRDDVMKSIAKFQQLLGKRTLQYRRPAQALYAAFITPIEGELAGADVDTLVFVPDGALRTIPLSALHDGERHLIEKYAIAITPGLTLFDPRPIARAQVDLLLGGLSEGVQGFSPLPHVTTEIENLKTLYGGEVYENEDFLSLRVERALDSRPFTVVHLATHAKFESDARASYLLTYDGRLSMDELENLIKLSRFREEPVELLTLSACDTAVGDERAALGLAGVAIKAGARSALASLWLVNDQAASVLVSEFYRELTTAEVSKAEALRRAQVAMINDKRYRYPVYWAPFLMIGNWL